MANVTKYTWIIVSVLTLLSCSKAGTKNDSFSRLKGNWVALETRTDTLYFKNWEGMEIMNLARGRELRDGNSVPKSGSGFYEYSITQETINLRWMLSSNANFKEYTFQVKENTLTIGNFYGSSSTDILEFEKLE